MKKIFNKKIGVLIFSLVCAGLANAVPVRSENEAVRLVQNSIVKHKFGGSEGIEGMRFYVAFRMWQGPQALHWKTEENSF